MATSYNIVTDKEKSLKPNNYILERWCYNATHKSNFRSCFCYRTFMVDFSRLRQVTF